MHRLTAVLAGVGLVLSLLVHLSTFAGIDPSETSSQVWLLHLGIFVLFISIAVRAVRRRGETRALTFPDLPYAPAWMRAATSRFFAYALANFAIFMYRTWEGGPTRRPHFLGTSSAYEEHCRLQQVVIDR